MRRAAVLTSVVLLLTAGLLSAAAEEGEVTLPRGAVLHLRLERSVGSDISHVEEPVRAVLTRPIVVHGRAVVPGGVALGNVVAVRRAGHLRERSEVAVKFTELRPSGEAEAFRIHTRTLTAQGPSLSRRDAEGVAVPAVGGAIIGGIIGGAKGAGIGAAAGGAAGTTGLMVTRGKDIRLRRGASIAVRLTEPATVHVR